MEKPAFHSVVLFGSLARGDRDFRDADLLFIVSSLKDKAPLHDAIADAFDGVRRRYSIPISAVIATKTELRSAKFSSVVDAVRRDGLVLAGSSPEVPRGVRVWRNAKVAKS